MSIKSSNSLRRPLSKTSSALASGAIDEEVFRNAFSSVSSLPIYSSRDLSEYMNKIKESLSVNAEDWERRMEALKTLRSVVASGGHQIEDFNQLLRSLENPVESCLRDLRSQVVREGCITVAYLSQELKNRFDHFAEAILQTLLNLILNSAKIMSTSGVAAINFIIRNIYAPRLLPIVTSGLSSKSAVLRKYSCIFMEPIFQLWPENVLEKHMGLLQEALRKGVSDADQDARSATRSAFQVFAKRFPANAESVLQSLDPSKRKMIEKSLSGDGSGSTSEASSLTNLASISSRMPMGAGGNAGTAKRITKPALGSSGITSSAARKPLNGTANIIDRTRPKIGLYGDVRSRVGSKKVSQSQPLLVADITEETLIPGLKILPLSNTADTLSYVDQLKTGDEFIDIPVSRETSPSSRTGSEYDYISSSGYGKHVAPVSAGYAAGGTSTIGRRSGVTDSGRRRSSVSRLPRSQASSRDTSPTSATGISAYHPGQYGIQSMHRPNASATNYQPSSMSDVGFTPGQASGYYRQQQESDDNASETSSMCSGRSGRSVPSHRRQQALRSINGVSDIISMLSSDQWAEKKDGLVHIQNHIRSGQLFSPPEIMRISEVLSQIFGASSSKVFTLFMETLQMFIKSYNQFLQEWIYGTMVRLFNRQSQEVLSTHKKAIQDTLAIVRSHFPLDLQFVCCCRYIIDDAATPNLKVKACVLEYLKDLLVMMPVEVMNNPSQEIIKGVTRVIGWSTEPKSADVRRLASRVVIKLSDLNPNAFARHIQQMPKNFQDQAAKLLKTYQKKTSLPGSPSSPTGLTAAQLAKLPTSPRAFSPISPAYVPQQAACAPSGDSMGYGRVHMRSSSIPDGQMDSGMHLRQPNYPLPHQYAMNGDGQMIQPGYNVGNVHNQFPVADVSMFSPIPSSPRYQQDVYGQDPGYQQHQDHNLSPNSNKLYQQSPPSLLTGLNNEPLYTKLKKPVIGYQTLKKIREMLPEDAISEILQELSNYNQRYEQRKACMLKLIKLLRDGSVETWTEHSKPTLLILLESLSDNAGETRALALRVLQELVRTQGELISEYGCLTVMKILESCNDADKSVIRSAEECALTVARYLPQDLCLRLLTTVITDEKTSLSLPAIKMQTQVIKFAPADCVEEELSALIPGLVAACSHDDSHVRKASIFCLVQIAVKFGDSIWQYLNDLNAGKKRLLRIYIEKENEVNMSNESVRISGNIPIH